MDVAARRRPVRVGFLSQAAELFCTNGSAAGPVWAIAGRERHRERILGSPISMLTAGDRCLIRPRGAALARVDFRDPDRRL